MSRSVLTLHNPADAREYYGSGHWRSDTFYSLLTRHSEERPEAPALRDGSRRITWADLKSRVDAVADGLCQTGVRPGERVSLLMSNRVEGVIAFLACAREGFIANPSLHRNHTASEIVTLLDGIGASGLIAETGWCAGGDAEDVLDASLRLNGLKVRWRLPAGRRLGFDFPITADQRQRPADPNPDKVCYLAFTSGTTGTPKGVMHSDNTLLANARDLVTDWGLGGSSVVLPLSPLSHHIFWVALSQVLLAGAELALNDPPRGASALDWILDTQATYVLGVPTHAMDILAEQRRRSVSTLGAVRTFYLAGAAIPPSVAEAFLGQGILPQNVYGMTENSSHNYTRPTDASQVICETNGRPGSAYGIRIFDAANPDVEVAPGEVGEIGGKGACLMLGYFANQAATERSFNSTGWFMSGDLGSLDPEGNLLFAGRLKDLIIRGGHNIYPARIEELAITHPAIGRAAAVPIGDERLGEKVCLAIVPNGGAPTPEHVLAHLHACGLSKYDMPEYLVVTESMPLTASGKILKRELTALLANGTLTPRPCRFTPTTQR